MEYTNLIHDFVEGTLDRSKEDELFMLFNSNEELRTELKQFIAMDKAFSRKLSTFIPSAKSTMGVFSTLGLNLPAGSANVSPALTKSPKGTSFFGKYSQGIWGGVLASAVTACVFLLIFSNAIFKNNPNGSEYQLSSIKEKESKLAPNSFDNKDLNSQQNSQAQPEAKIPIVVSKSSDEKPKIRTKIVYVPVEKSSIADNNIVTTKELPKESVQENIQEPVSHSIPDINSNNKLLAGNEQKINPMNLRNNSFNLNPVQINEGLKPVIFLDKPVGFTLELKGSQYWQLRNTPIAESWIPKFYNMGATLLYNVSDELAFGLDVRNEHYYQQFHGTDLNNEEFLYKQFPNYLVWSGVGKWKFLKFSSYDTFSQFMLGGTNTGMVGRLMLGVEYSPQPQFTFMLGVEGSVLGYNYQGTTYFSPKMGLNYGVAFNF
jgi:hypothetical protein